MNLGILGTVKKNFSLSFAVAAMLVFAGAAQARASDEIKIGVVDMQKALQTVDAGRKAKAQLESEFNSRKKELDAEKASLEKAGQEFKKQSLVMSDEARAKKQGELQERYMKLQESFSRSQQEIQQKEQELTGPILNRLRTVINEIAKQKGFTVVLEKNENTVLYSQDRDDITQDVIKTFNSKKGSS
ncbi:MAG: OmpH family outer membrane protein [Oligoflexia bacterium]|nr:OmpH family outer membrane protein [Oligoflexia bacterium]